MIFVPPPSLFRLLRQQKSTALGLQLYGRIRILNMPFLRDIPGITPTICSADGVKSTLAAGTVCICRYPGRGVIEVDEVVASI